MRPAIVSGIVTGNVSVSYWPIFSPSVATVPEVFVNVNSAQSHSRFLSGELSFKLNKRKYFSHSHFFSNYT